MKLWIAFCRPHGSKKPFVPCVDIQPFTRKRFACRTLFACIVKNPNTDYKLREFRSVKPRKGA